MIDVQDKQDKQDENSIDHLILLAKVSLERQDADDQDRLHDLISSEVKRRTTNIPEQST